MTPERARSAEDLFASALGIPAAQRGEFLNRHCGSDAGLRAEIESLLRWHDLAEAETWELPAGSDSEVRHMASYLRARTLESRRVGSYELLEFLGEGSTGLVYRARDTRTTQIVALKIASPQTMADAASRRRFRSAATAAMRLSHPHIARVIDVGASEEAAYVALEYVEGSTLAAELLLRRPEPVQALQWVRQIAEALDYAHRQGVIHRDLKPANLMVAPWGDIKVLDFGICHISNGADEKTRTRTGVALGTLGYLAPEQARGETPLPQSDLFSLGAVLYELLTGRAAFPGDTPIAILSAVLEDTPPSSRVRPQGAMDLALWLMEKDPRRRPRSAARVVGELDQLVRGRGSSTRTLRRAARALRLPTWKPATTLAAFGLVCVAGLSVYRTLRINPTPSLTAIEITHETNVLDMQPVLSPDRRSIAFASDRGGDGHIDLWIVSASGGVPRRLTRGELNASQPEFSPDSRSVVYRSERDGGGLFRIPIDGGALPVQLVHGGLRPRYSPDGKWILYWNGLETSGDLFANGGSKAFVMSADGRERRPICPDFSAAVYPIWSPDGSMALFAGRKSAGKLAADETGLWITTIDACRPVPIGKPGDFPDSMFASPYIPERWLAGGQLIFRSMNDAVGLRQIVFSPATGKLLKRATTLALPVHGGQIPSVLDARTVVYADSHFEANLWSVPLDAAAIGAPALTVRCSALYCIPALSSDGSLLVYSRYTPNGWEFVQRDLRSGKDDTVAPAAGHAPPRAYSPWPFVAGGAALYLRQTSALPGGDARYAITRILPRSGPKVIWPDSRELWDVSSTGRYALAMNATGGRTVDLIDLVKKTTTELLAHPQWNIYRASFSPDETEVVFTAKISPDRSQLFVTDLIEGRTAPPSQWIPITTATEYNGPAHWSTDGERIYFFSQRDSRRCLYVRAWDRRRHAPAGPLVEVAHFHQTSTSPSLIPQSLFGFAVSRDRIVLETGEQKGRIWLIH